MISLRMYLALKSVSTDNSFYSVFGMFELRAFIQDEYILRGWSRFQARYLREVGRCEGTGTKIVMVATEKYYFCVVSIVDVVPFHVDT